MAYYTHQTFSVYLRNYFKPVYNVDQLHYLTSRQINNNISFCVSNSLTTMKETLPRFLLPTADMKKALNRNAKNDEDLSFLLKRIEKEKKVALEQVSRRQKAFKREMIMRREIQSNINLNCQFFEHTDLTNKKDNEKARLDINLCNRRRKLGTAQGLRRASSFEESLASSKIELPPVRTKRYSLPASPIQARCKEEELRVKSLKIDKPFPTPKVVTDFWTKSRDYEATNLF